MTLPVVITFGVRLLLVMLFLPFSALDKALNFNGALVQASEIMPWRPLAAVFIVAGFCIEVGMSAAILLGVADRAAALVLALYCIATALLWKRFWRPGDFWSDPNGKARGLFWDFWKNLALAGGFLLLTFGGMAGSVNVFLAHPLSSTDPYAAVGAP